jgi:hypothetical protein
MIRILIVICLISSSVPVVGQFKNVLLDPAGAYEPSMAMGRKSTDNLVASASPNVIYTSANGGLSWEKTKLTTGFEVSGNLVVFSDFKNTFYCLHTSRIGNKNQIIIRESSDGGKSWSDGVRISQDTTAQAFNPAAALDRKGNLFVTWTAFSNAYNHVDSCKSSIMLSRSSSGKKWSKPVVISQTPGSCNHDRQTTVGATPGVMGGGERAFVVWAHQEKIVLDRAFDGGSTWLSNDLPITDQSNGANIEIEGVKSSNGYPTMLVDNTKKTQLSGAVYIVWADQLKGKTDTDIWFTRSMNFGDSWTQAGRINNDASGKHQYNPAMALDSESGFIYVVYYDRRNYTDTQTDVYLAYSLDAGSTFKNVKISENPFVADAAVITGSYIGISAHNGVITPIWTRTDNGKSSVWMSVIKQSELEKVKE